MDAGFKEERPPHPRAKANIFEILTFGWTLKLFKTGRKRDLEVNDLYITLNDHSSATLGNELEKKWRIELAKAKQANRQPSLLRTLLQMFGPKLMLYGFLLSIVEIVLSVCQPIFLGHIIIQFEPDIPSDQSSHLGILYGICLLGTVALKTFGFTAYDMLTTHMGMKMRVSTCFLVYNKVPLWTFSQ